MKKHLAIPIALIAGLAFGAQKQITFTDPSKNIEVVYTSVLGRIDQGGIYRFDFRSPGSKVHATIHDRALEFFADRVQGVAVPKTGRGMILESATASGGVRVIKGGDGNRSEITGSVAKFADKGSNASLSLSGPVRLTNFNSAKGSSLRATGSSLEATMASFVKAADALQTATLRGPVTIDVTDHTSAKGIGTLHVTANRLDIDNTSRPAKLTLTGGVNIKGSKLGQMNGLGKAVLTLNERGEVVSVEFKS